MGAVLLGVVEGSTLLQMGSSLGQFPEIEQGQAMRLVGLEEESGFLETLSQGEELFCQLPRRVVLRPCAIKPPEPAQHGEELWRLTHLPTQLKGPGVGPFHLRGCRAFSGEQRWAK